ncbi:hypothetical protein CBR_g25958 [Chara braunii]|uniref:Reverse transcriptase n=1 Tax=Chara braunii TaxID=69332 RepID=A0A388L6W3_CHABU|nr:hypothetical protein CBR_g25958 [Chara braunii]|eukprot:GBG78024.1 hypothetical protein CBR_g25958 [Chara braunii]
MCGYYRNFVKNYSTVASPLTDLTRLDTPWNWSDECEGAFKRLKHALMNHEVLMVPDPQKPFIVTTDASQYDIGEVLAQQDGKKLRSIEYMSKKMPSKKLAKSTYERELYALYKALVHWRHFLLGRFFYLRTDHQTLKWIKTQPVLSDALKRWIEVIDQYDFKLEYLKGEYNTFADAPSRREDHLGALVSDFGISDEVTQSLVGAYQEDLVTMDIIHKLQAKDKATERQSVSMDFMDTLVASKSGKRHIFVIKDRFTKRSMLPPTMDGQVDIDDIVDHRDMPVAKPLGRGRPPKPKREYRVRFRHHTDPKEDRWFTREELIETAPQVVAEYERKLKGKAPTKGGGVATVEVVVDEHGDDVDVEVEAEACPEEGVVWGVEEGGVVVVTTVMVRVFPSSAVTASEMAAMVVLMESREDWRAVNVRRKVASSGVAMVEVGGLPASSRAMLSMEPERRSDMLMDDWSMLGEEGVEDAAGTDVEDAAAAVAVAAAAASAAACWEFLVWQTATTRMTWRNDEDNEHDDGDFDYDMARRRMPRQPQCHVSHSATSTVVPCQQQCHVSNSATSECNVSSATSATVPRQQCHVTVPRQQCPATMTGTSLGMPGQRADEFIADYKQRFQSQLALIEAEEQRQLAAEAARVQAEAAGTAEKQRLQAEADADTQAHRKEAQDLLQRHEAADIERLEFWHFQPSNGDDATPEEQHREFLSKLVTRLLYACNYQLSELERQNQELQQQYQDLKKQHQELANRRRTVQSNEDATRALNSRVLDQEQAAPGPDAGESSSAPSTRQLEERVDHVVAMRGDISTFAERTTISNQMDTLKTEVQQLQLPNKNGNSTQHYKMPTFQIEKFDDYTHQDPVLWWEVPTPLMDVGVEVVDLHAYIAKIDREFKTQRYDDIDAPLLYVRIQIGEATCNALIDCGASRNYMSQDFMLLDAYGDEFEGPHGVVPDRPIRHEIILEDGAVPPRGCIYRMSEEEFSVLRAQLDDLLEKGWIRPSSSPYGAPVLFVRKKNKDLRLCIDYRKLNAQMIRNADPLPRIDDLLERLGSAKFFSKLDLKSGYHQLEIRKADRYKTGFKTRYWHFKWLVMPFGLTNAPTTFQAAMTTEFRHMLYRFVLIYLDDILVYSRSLDEYVEHLRTVLERLRQAKYKANRDKCEFARQELEYLGHYVTPQGIRPLADKIEALRVWPEPTNTTEVRSFMGLAGYYQRFIAGYSRIVAPMTRLQSPKVPFVFDDDARRSFQALKTIMLMAPVLSIYDPTLSTRVTTEASGYGIGAVLEQHDGDDWHPVEYFSHKVPPINSLDDARKELLAFVTALKRWRHFLLGRRRFICVTDNNPLIYYKTQDMVSSTIGGWMYFIDQFDFTPKHVPGLSNRTADARSLRPDLCAMTHHAFPFDEELQRHFIRGYESDPDFATLYAQLSSDHPPASHYRIADGYLLLHSRGKDLLFVPRDRRLRTCHLGEYHDSRLAGHFGVNRTIARLRQRFRWTDLITDVTSDNDARFMSAFWTAVMQESDTKMKASSARHPQTDGQTERAHQTAQMMLRTLICPDQKDCVDRLPDIKFANNTSVNPAIGVTPFELHHGGRKGRIFADLPLPRPADIDAARSPAPVLKYRELLAQALANMQKAQVRMQQQASRHRVPCPIHAGDLVWVSAEEFALEQDVSRKLLFKWFGPWPVTSAAGDEPDGPSFVINIPRHLTVHPVFHASKLATYTPAKSDDFQGRRSQDPPSMDGHQEVERVITDRKYGSKPSV